MANYILPPSSASYPHMYSPGPNYNLRKGKGQRKGKQSTRMTKARAQLIEDFRTKRKSYSKMGSQVWGSELYDYLTTNGETAVIREDVSRWIRTHKWITEPITPDPDASSHWETPRIVDVSGGVQDSPFVEFGRNDPRTKDPLSSGTTLTTTYQEEAGDVDEAKKMDQCINPKLQNLAIGLSKLEDFNRWLETEPKLKRCFDDSARILNRIHDELHKSVMGGRADTSRKTMCPIRIKQEAFEEDIEEIPIPFVNLA